jgi:hypothetical protein
MKKILIATLLIGMISGCAKKNGLPMGVVVFNWEGHQYLKTNRALMHSESCSNPIHKEKQK